MKTFTLVINSGRSGSTFLKHLLSSNYAEQCYIAHEDIPVQISRPRIYNRAYTEEAIRPVLDDSELSGYCEKWENILKDRSIIETGWTSCHLAPVLLRRFGAAFRVVILHRDPVSYAFSRANMGNYHSNTFYDDAHEVSPHDPQSIAPEYAVRWAAMNHFEKCMFWWYTVYLEAYEFKEMYPDVPCMTFPSSDLFKLMRIDPLLEFLGFNGQQLQDVAVPRNELPRFMQETFPIGDEWRRYQEHDAILGFAEGLGYSFEYERIERLSFKYKLPRGMGPLLRNKTKYWKVKSMVAGPLKKVLRPSARDHA